MTQTAEEEKSLVELSGPPHSDKPESPEEALVGALRKFVRREAQQPEPPEEKTPQKIGVFQAVVLLVIVLNAVLLYGEFQDWFDNPLFVNALKVLPWLLGATAFAYSDKVRGWVLAKCQSKVVAAIAILVALPLLILRQPVFSIIASLASDSTSVSADNPDNKNDKLAITTLDSKRIRITVPDLLKPYRIKVKDTDESLHPVEFPEDLGRWRIVKGTIAQLPLIGRLFGNATLQLTPLYQVRTQSTDTVGMVNIEGTFDEKFLQQISDLSKLRCTKVPSSSVSHHAIRCRVPKGFDAFPLPPGTYTLKLSRSGCNDVLTVKDRRVPEDGERTITFDDLCPR